MTTLYVLLDICASLQGITTGSALLGTIPLMEIVKRVVLILDACKVEKSLFSASQRQIEELSHQLETLFVE